MRKKTNLTKIALTFISSISVCFCFGQNKSSLTDSLWSVFGQNISIEKKTDALNTLGYLYIFIPGKQDSSLLLLNDALNLIDTTMKSKQFGINLLNRGIYNSNVGRLKLSVENTLKSIDQFRAINDPVNLSKSYINLGSSYNDIAEYEKAENILLELLDYLKVHPNLEFESSAHHNLAIAYGNLNRYEEALTSYEKSLSIKRELVKDSHSGINSKKRRIANTLDAMANLYYDMGQIDKAGQYHEEALQIWKEIKFDLGIFIGLHNSGVFYEKEKQYEKAEDYLLQALEMKEKIKNPKFISYGYTTLGNIYNATNEFEKAILAFKNASDANKELKESKTQIEIHKNLSKVYSKKGAIDEAIEESHKAFEIAKDKNNAIWLSEIQNQLSELYEKNDQKKEALFYLKNAMIIEDSISQLNKTKNLINLDKRLSAEVEQKKRVLELERSLSRSTIQRRNYIIGFLSVIALLAGFFLVIIFKRNRQLKLAFEASERQNDQLLDLSDKLQKFVFGASHDIKESLRSMMSFSQLLKREKGALSPKTESYFQAVESGGHRMENVLNSLLNYARLSGEDLKMDLVDLNRIIPKMQKRYQHIEGGVQLIFNGLPKLYGDARLLNLMFVQLFDNAVRFREKNRPLVVEVGLKLSDENNNIFFIKDNGIGVEEKYLEQIFKPFFRLHERSVSGSGMGLAICDNIVVLHNGAIHAESVFGESTTIFVRLPKEERKDPE